MPVCRRCGIRTQWLEVCWHCDQAAIARAAAEEEAETTDLSPRRFAAYRKARRENETEV